MHNGNCVMEMHNETFIVGMYNDNCGMECTCNLTCNWLFLICYMFYYKVNGSWMAKTLDSLQGNLGSNLSTNKGNLVIC
jgi:hypothetical protein